MTRVVISTVRLLEFLEGAGHFWVYMQYAQALRRLGCEVYVLDSYTWSEVEPDAHRLREFLDRMARYGLQDRVVVTANGSDGPARHFGMPETEASDLLDSADLLLNFNYHLSQALVSAAPAECARGHRPRLASVLDQPRIHRSRRSRPVLHDR